MDEQGMNEKKFYEFLHTLIGEVEQHTGIELSKAREFLKPYVAQLEGAAKQAGEQAASKVADYAAAEAQTISEQVNKAVETPAQGTEPEPQAPGTPGVEVGSGG